MATSSAGVDATTYLATSEDLAEIVNLVEVLARRGVVVPAAVPALVDGEGHRVELPRPVFEALREVVRALAAGQGVTVAPHNALLTTQEAADLLGVSRPTLVKLLIAGEIPFERRGRHRRVMLADVLDYQRRSRAERRAVLAQMVAEGEESGLYDVAVDPSGQPATPTAPEP